MSTLLFLLGGLGALVSLAMLIVSLVRGKSKKKALISLGVFFLMFAVSLAIGPDAVDDTSVENAEEDPIVSEQQEPEEVKDEEPVAEEKPEAEKVEESSKATLAQQNAIKQAENYLSFSGFSKTGLVEQLEYEGYETADAQYAVDNINVDWMEQAVIKGKSYLDTMSFSRTGLIEQLEFEGFTNEQATYAVNEIGL